MLSRRPQLDRSSLLWRPSWLGTSRSIGGSLRPKWCVTPPRTPCSAASSKDAEGSWVPLATAG
eukprot:5988164-Lingulodinium_polyedra.AAC.1